MPGLMFYHRNYRQLCVAGGMSNLGDGVLLLAFPWLATLVSRDPMHVALVVMATRLPWLLFSIPVGVLTDRFDRRLIMLIADVIRLLLGVGVTILVVFAPELPGLAASREPSLVIVGLALFAFLLGIAEVFRDNAAQTFLPSVVDTKDLERANGQLWTIEQITGSFVGPPLAGFLIALAVPAPFAFAAVSFAASALCLGSITGIASTTRTVHEGLYAEMMTGIKWIMAHRLILTLAIMLGVLNAVSTLSLTVLVLYSQEVLGLTAIGHGTLLTASAFGGVAGGVFSPAIVERLGNRTSVLLSLLVWPVGFLGIYLTSSTSLVAFILFIEMFAAVLWNVVTVTYRQRFIPEHLLGRVNSIYRCFGWGMMPLGALGAGVLMSILEPLAGRELALRLPFLIASVSCALLLFYALRFLSFNEKDQI